MKSLSGLPQIVRISPAGAARRAISAPNVLRMGRAPSMHTDHVLIEQRVRKALERRIRPEMYGPAVPLAVSAWQAPGAVGYAAAREGTYHPFAVGDAWGAPWSTTWFALAGEVPAGWEGQPVEALIDLGWPGGSPGFSCEGLVYDAAGNELKGLAARSCWVPVPPAVTRVELWLEAAANPHIDEAFPLLGDPGTAGDQPLYRLRRAELAVRRPAVAGLVSDIEVLLGLAVELAGDDPRRAIILRALERMLDRLGPGEVEAGAAQAAVDLAEVLAQPAVPSAHRISAIGNAHIDTAWLWPLAETRRKVARTLASALQLAETEPDQVFAFSQAQQLDWLRADRPALYERVRAAIASGRIVLVGGLWVEPDGNLPGGEAMVRQMVYGKRFFLEQFGIETEDVWMPDSFGYTAALPQIAALAGNRFMLTQKLSWNQTNRFPHHTFWWEGIDGTRLFTHFPPVDTYNAEMTPAELVHAARSFAEAGWATRSLVPFGYGDGGGGPTREMVAAIHREANLEGLPRVAIQTPAAFFAEALQEYPDAPVWSGELYLELHRGTFTSQARVKAANRRCEHLLREAELWAATAAVRQGATYPAAELERLWKQVCLLQFHDILPGSSIAWVYDDAEAMYATVIEEAEAIVADALHTLAGSGAQTVRFNATPHAWAGVPPLGAAPDPPPGGPPARVDGPDEQGAFVLDNGLVRATVDRAGLVTALEDLRHGRQALAPGSPGNLLQLHHDTPNHWEAWDVDAFYRNRHVDLTDAETVAVEITDPDHAAVRVRRRFGASGVEQVLSLRPGEACLRIDTEIDWHEQERFLKVAWPFDVHAGEATSEIQFGHVRRPTHANTSWDAARFETWAHRFVHVGEAGWGVALTTTAQYGHDVSRSTRPGGGTTTTVRLSLLRGPCHPDPEADQGRHRFSWRVHPGAGIADAIREGYRTNLPIRSLTGGAAPEPLVRVDGGEALIEAVKLADDGSGDVVVRLYEPLGGQTTGSLVPGFPAGELLEVDLLERPAEKATGAVEPLRDGASQLRLRPFQILTVRIRRATV
jgi:alpha-mannosidase